MNKYALYKFKRWILYGKIILKDNLLISWAVSKKMRADVSYFGP